MATASATVWLSMPPDWAAMQVHPDFTPDHSPPPLLVAAPVNEPFGFPLNQMAALVASKKITFLLLGLVKVPWALNWTVGVGPEVGTVAENIGEHAGVGLGLGVCVLVGLGVGVGAGGEPKQIARAAIVKADPTPPLEPPPPPPQLRISAAATNESTGTTTRHLRHQFIEH